MTIEAKWNRMDQRNVKVSRRWSIKDKERERLENDRSSKSCMPTNLES